MGKRLIHLPFQTAWFSAASEKIRIAEQVRAAIGVAHARFVDVAADRTRARAIANIARVTAIRVYITRIT
jgi:hypothetical protein